QDIDELGQLVDAVLAQETANRCDPGVAPDLEQHAPFALVQVGKIADHRVCTVDHRAEFDHLERLAIHTDALGAVEDWALAGQLDCSGDSEQYGESAKQNDAREHEVEQALLKMLGAVVLRLRDMNQL